MHFIKIIFADAFTSVIYVSTDEGETFNLYTIPADPKTLKVHPTLARWILGYDASQVKCAVMIRAFYHCTISKMMLKLFNFKKGNRDLKVS